MPLALFFRDLKSALEKGLIEKLKEQGDPRIFSNGDIFDNYPYAGAVKYYYNRYMGGEKVPASWVNKTDYDSDLIGE